MTDCSSLHSLTNGSDVCTFVRTSSGCDIDEGFINYTVFAYCDIGHKAIVLACVILVIWWLFLFCGLAVTADDFFCPSLAVISKNLKLSHNVAGVTFLAFGNGAPDIFSAIAAIGSAKAGDAGLAIGALFGAGVFVTAVVAGTIAIVCPFQCMERPFLRDVIFYLAAVFWAWYVMWDKQITQWEAAGFILLYVFYVVVVILGRFINQRLKNRRRGSGAPLIAKKVENSEGTSEEGIEPGIAASINVDIEVSVSLREVVENRAPLQLFWADVNPINMAEWSDMNLFWKFYECFKSPLVLLLNLTVPIVGQPEDDNPEALRNWNRPLNSLHIFTGPVFSMFATKLGFNTLGPVFPAWALVMLVCAVLAVAVFVTSNYDKRPVYHTAFAYLGFIVAVVWIYSIANEIVNILQTLGIVFTLSDAILGLTLLAWGNSIGDLIADTTMARQGYPRMGFSACFGGPLFNMLMGLGLAFTFACIKHEGTFHLQVRVEEMVLAAGLAASLVFTLIVVPASRFHMSRPYGILLLCLYVTFLVIAILVEVGVIHNSYL